MRVNIYVDGLNLYYGALKNTRHKWLNLQDYFSKLRHADDIQVIKYFTAEIGGSHKPNQEKYLLALGTLPKVLIILGKFKSKTVKCRIACGYTGDREFTMPEEKRTDVNIAVHMLHDAIYDKVEHLVLVSGDSDLVPALKMIKEVAPQKRVTVYVPSNDLIRGAAVEIRSAADKNRTLPDAIFPKAQFLQKVSDGHGGWIEKPKDW